MSQRVKIALYALTTYLQNKFRIQPKNKLVLIVFQQVFGDSVLLLPALQGYMELYHKRRGYEVTMICKPAILRFLQDIAELPKGLHVEAIDFKRLFDDYAYFKEVVNKYRYYAEIVIAPGSSLSADLLITTLCTNQRYGQISCYRTRKPLQLALFQRLAYTDAVISPAGMMKIQAHRLMLNYLGLIDYKGKLSSLRPQPKIIESRYCIICPGASTAIKCWPIERFRDIADWLIDTYNIDIYLCGGAPEREASNKLIATSCHKERIHNKVGDTSFKEWASIVEYAELVLGNDSATLHIAAAYRRKCICVAGVYDKFQFFPYLVDELEDEGNLPITIYKDMPCAYCRTKGYFAGAGNYQCQSAIKLGKCALCIEEITVEEVKRVIENIYPIN